MIQSKNFLIRFILVTFSIVLILGVLVIWTSYEVPSLFQNSNVVVSDFERNPAAINFQKSTTNNDFASKNDIESSEVNLDCRSLLDNSTIKVQSKLVKIIGKNCINKIESNENNKITITNLTNGFTATVFNLKENKISTDYIQLKEGKNLISLTWMLNSDNLIQKKFELLR